jgi:hypothetical protein
MIALLVTFVLAAFLMLRSQSTLTTTPTYQSSTPTYGSNVTTTTIGKSQVRVQVANSTSVQGLARTYTQQLMTAGWDTLPQMNGPKVNQTIVYYNPGFLWAAQEIATSIGTSQSGVTALGGLTPVPGAAGDDVIVLLGPDLAVKS